jgi:hypothetical protein
MIDHRESGGVLTVDDKPTLQRLSVLAEMIAEDTDDWLHQMHCRWLQRFCDKLVEKL